MAIGIEDDDKEDGTDDVPKKKMMRVKVNAGGKNVEK